MNIKNRIVKLENTLAPNERVLLGIKTHEGDPDEVIDRVKSEAIDAWKAANPERIAPAEFEFLRLVVMKPRPTALTQGIH